jgi:hypothetical protein
MWMFGAASGGGSVGTNYVHRPNQLSADATAATLTLNNAWHVLDLSAIVPPNTKVVVVRTHIKDGTLGLAFRLRAVGDIDGYGRYDMYIVVINRDFFSTGLIVFSPTSTVEYWCSTGMDLVEITVCGWFA